MFSRECWMECPACGSPAIPPSNLEGVHMSGEKPAFREGLRATCDNCESDLEVYTAHDGKEEYLDVRHQEVSEEDE